VWAAAAAVLLTALCAVLAVQTASRAARADGNDFTSYLLATRALWNGENPYTVPTPFPFIYPLFLCVLLAPLASAPYAASVALWYAANVAAIGLALTMTLRLSGAEPRRMVVVLAVVCLLMGGVLQDNLLNGQVNPIVLGLCVVFAWCHLDGRPHAAAMALGAAIALKLTPAILLLFLIRRRAWAVAGEAVAAAIVLAAALPWLVAGDRVQDYYTYYVDTFLRARLSGVALVDPVTFSLAGVWRALSSTTGMYDALVFALLAAAALLIIDRGEGADDRSTATLTVCLYLAASLLVTPMSEMHHLIYLMPGLAVLTWRAARPAGASTRSGLVALGAVYLALIAIRARLPTEFGGVLGTCGLLVAAIVDTRHAQRRGDPPR
jgi:alpha-1,2-mannosyltransferase